MKNCNCKYKESCMIPDEMGCTEKMGTLRNDVSKLEYAMLTKNNQIQRLIVSLMEVLHEYNYTLTEEYNRSVLDSDQLQCKDAIESIEEITRKNVKDIFK